MSPWMDSAAAALACAAFRIVAELIYVMSTFKNALHSIVETWFLNPSWL